VAVASFDTLDEVRARLRTDTPFYAEQCLWIIDKRKRGPARAESRAAPLRRSARGQRRQGSRSGRSSSRPARSGSRRGRRAKIIQRVTQNENHDALVVAHDMETAKKLFRMGHTMWRNLPQHPQLAIKPPISNRRIGRELHFGNPSRARPTPANVGLNSSYASAPPRRSRRAVAAPCRSCTGRRSRSGTTSRGS
jgi:hypothetical protein